MNTNKEKKCEKCGGKKSIALCKGDWCIKENSPSPKENWEEEFEKEFKSLRFTQYGDDLKDFIRHTRTQAYEEGYKTCTEERKCGKHQSKEIIRTQILQELEAEMPIELPVSWSDYATKRFPPEEIKLQTAANESWNSCRSAILNIIKSKKK